MRILVTGSAGFIGFHTCLQLLKEGHEVWGLDSFTDYYDVKLKRNRQGWLRDDDRFTHVEADMTDHGVMQALVDQGHDYVIHLAAQAGVRHSLDQPQTYIDTNITGFLKVLEAIRHSPVPPKRLLYASSSSVYGSNTAMPFTEGERTDAPSNLYAASKKSNELMAESYGQLFGIRSTAMRFFTVYGPWGRPDMALFKFTKAVLEGSALQLFNGGNHQRDWTYISDIVSGIMTIMSQDAELADRDCFNLCSGQPIELKYFVSTIENLTDKPAFCDMLPLQPGDIQATWGDNTKLRCLGWKPEVGIEQGISKFITWYEKYYKENT
tara:strand:- start:6234 stop:7202 length:969 start_codon:yes stop_codon:yes gene_type:complete